ncbi:hypothetical protein [Croceicoccus sp. BE223]|uniref:hypothetical protein n=1 Tax=Croceicoccus sp. BE223 TaxID=2817716 RepID=UPI002860D213|nr:hypothetical protein [Croceicoccus sp. BE223]MDR7102969.1 hypothetical protein [Croceicoccus sp. BE223]
MREGGAAQFVIPALTQYEEPGDMAKWLATAKPGEIIMYATGPMLGNHPAKRLALRWQEQGKAVLFQRRSQRVHCFDYFAKKCGAANDASGGARQVAGSPPRDDAWRESRDGRVYALLFRDVAAGRCCPSNGEIAERLDLHDRYAAKDALTRLKAMGLIRFEQAGRTRTRIVTIVATGQSSADVQEVRHG